MSEKNLPLKLVLHKENDTVKNTGRKNTKYFCNVNDELKTKITEDFDKLLDYYSDVFQESEMVPAVGKIKVKKEAIAKSHKPNSLCRECDIIGTGLLGEIYIKVTKESIEKTKSLVSSPPSKEFEANMTTVEEISPIFAEEKISEALLQVNENSEYDKVKEDIKVKLFDFDDDFYNSQVLNYVFCKLSQIGLSDSCEVVTFGDNIKFLKISTNSFDDIVNISNINGVKSIDFFQKYSLPSGDDYELGIAFDESKINSVDSETVIGIIDSGISEENKLLNGSVLYREEYVAAEYQNRSHGTFVASIIQYGNLLNNIESKNDKKFKFVDIVAIPNSDPMFGPVESLSEYELMLIIEDAMEKYSGLAKVWNLSLGSPQICSDSISDLAIFFDYIQDKYHVQFIVSSGNYEGTPQRTWPPQTTLGETDRITSPADSVRSITVGSLACFDSDTSIVKSNQPSSFSRRGPGANYIVKPDLVDYGGNLNYCGSKDVFMKGLDTKGNIIGDIGTSFSTPRITQKFASILDDMIDKDLLLTKALIVHSARLNSRELLDDTDMKNYYGFGMPSVDSQEILNCSKDEITLIFRQKIKKGSHLEMIDFPYPKSLIENGKCKGEICMTLLYSPLVDENYGQEYCRSNVDVSFGTYTLDSEGKTKFQGRVPLETTWDEKFESFRVEHGFKWCPVKSYYRNIKRGFQCGDGWKIRVDMHERNEADILEQEFVLIITIKDVEGRDIYSDVVTMLKERGYITEDLKTRYNVRERSYI